MLKIMCTVHIHCQCGVHSVPKTQNQSFHSDSVVLVLNSHSENVSLKVPESTWERGNEPARKRLGTRLEHYLVILSTVTGLGGEYLSIPDAVLATMTQALPHV